LPSALTANLWAAPASIGGNLVRQLLVPEGKLDVVDDGKIWVVNSHGRWPAIRDAHTPTNQALYAQLPVLRTQNVRVAWKGDRSLADPMTVVESYAGAFAFRPVGEPGGLRRPQIGALHSVIGYWSSGVSDPGIVIMPTGTGKTETMIALLVAAQIRRLLVIVPSMALREQIASKFETLGILQKHAVVAASALRPCVGRLEHGIADEDDARAFARACNVVVATPQAVAACAPHARAAMLSEFSHLMVDEAHHSAATSWANIIQAFTDRPVLLFTATPFREDGRRLPGRTLFRFPLREAQADGYFTEIDYQAVLSLTGTDDALADLAIARLRRDRAEGLDHILMARGASVARAKEILMIYEAKAPDLGPAILHEGLSTRRRREVMEALQSRACRVIVCVDMLGEGFDLPSLKVAALHDVKKSLSPMIQLVGRFTRSSSTSQSPIGKAAVFVARDPSVALSPLRDLLREDADWNLLLHDITERITVAAEQASEFEASFTGTPEDVAVNLLEPKMSAVAYRSPSQRWSPESILDLYDSGQILGGRIAIGAHNSVAWFIREHRTNVRWGEIQDLEEVKYELIILYFNEAHRVLYIYGSEKSGAYTEVAEAVLGSEAVIIRGPGTFRVLARLDRLIPTNVGLLDARDHFNRFSMHVGSDVVEALDTAERQGKSQTHIATTGFDNGEKVSISAAMSGRFWSMRTATSLKAWTEWCDEQGAKLLDATIDLEKVFNGFIIPEDLLDRPPFVLLGLEWPWELYTGVGPGVTVTYAGATYPVTDVGFEVDDYGTAGPFRFSLVTPAWRIPYRADFGSDGLVYSPLGNDVEVHSRPTSVPMQDWINRRRPALLLEGDRMITPDDRLLAPRYDIEPFDRTKMTALNWAGVNIQVESQGEGRRSDSIQAFMSAHLQREDLFDVLIDDDRAGEAADLVGLRVDDTRLVVTLVHCKYSSSPQVGARLGDLYELCGQAMRGAKWRHHGAEPLLRHLDRRATHYANRTGTTPYEVGDITDLYRIREIVRQLRPEFRTIVVQPGLSAAGCTDEHLRLLAGARSYVHTVARSSFDVYCSP